MRTTIELPDELLRQAKAQAALGGTSLKEFFVDAVKEKLATGKTRVRRPPPLIGGSGPPIGDLSAEQIDEAMFGELPREDPR